MMFGTPIVMNPIFLIPFIASPVISLFATLGVMKIGLVAMPTGATVNNFIPLPILGSLVNAHWTGFVWTCILIVLNMALYYPFFLIADKKALQDEKNNEEQSETEKIEEA
jgi:PTS system cellobiose-specific IIC component